MAFDQPPQPESATSTSFPARQFLLVLVVAACLFFIGLGSLPLLEPDEGRNAEVAREMLASGDWITPHFNTFPYLDKPALFFWLAAESFRLWGVSEWAARFPSALMALATALLIWFLARRMFGDSAGLRAGIIWVTSPLVIAFSRIVILDMTLTFLLTLALVSFGLAEASNLRHPWLDGVLFAAMGLATITKGPVGFLFPLLTILVYQALRGRFRELKRLRWRLGLAIFLAAALPWFVVVSVRNPAFLGYALWQETLLRFATTQAHRAGGLLYYIPVFLAGFFPWSFFLVFAGWNQLKRWRELKQETHKPQLLLLVWVAVIVVFFSISRSKLPGYFLPATVPLSILMAKGWAEAESKAASRRPDWQTAGFATLIGLGLLTAAAPQLFRFHALQVLGARKIPPAVIPLIKPYLLYTGFILAGLGILGRKLAARARRNALSPAFVLLALTVPSLIVRWIVPLETYVATSSSRRIARTILQSPERELPLYGYYYFRTSLPFYLRRPVGLVTADGSEMTSHYVVSQWAAVRRQTLTPGPSTSSRDARTESNARQARQDKTAGQLLIDARELRLLSRSSPDPVLVMVRNSHVRQLTQTVGPIDPLWDDGEYSVWKIPPGKR